MSNDHVPPGPCPICERQLNRPLQMLGAVYFDCPGCGQVALSANLTDGTRMDVADETRFKLKHLLFERRLKKGGEVYIGTVSRTASNNTPIVTIAELVALYPKNPLEYFDRALENLARLAGGHPTASAMINEEMFPALFSEGNEAIAMLQQLQGLGYIELESMLEFVVKPHGWNRIQQLNSPGRDSKQGFVAMRFDATHADLFDQGFKPAIEADGVTKAFIVNRKEHNNKIDDEIIAEIRRSKFVVADYTGHRPNVYYEAGFALGLGLPVIWCISDSEGEAPHFDTRQYSYIRYKSPEDLKAQLLNRIRATIP